MEINNILKMPSDDLVKIYPQLSTKYIYTNFIKLFNEEELKNKRRLRKKKLEQLYDNRKHI